MQQSDLPKLFALAWSNSRLGYDPSTQNGAIIVSVKDEISRGYNDLPRGYHHDFAARTDRELKNAITGHAERDAIYFSARGRYSTADATMIALWAACPTCAEAIITSGIARLFRLKWYTDNTPDRWRKSVELGDEMLSRAGVDVIDWVGKFGEGYGPLRFDGKPVTPEMTW